MKIGDLVTVIQPESMETPSPGIHKLIGEVGIIINEQLGMFRNQDSFSVATTDRVFVVPANYLEVINESG